jgi:hypothetical protein
MRARPVRIFYGADIAVCCLSPNHCNMDQHIITVYIDDKPYRFRVNIDHKKEKTTYLVSSENEEDFIPQDFRIDEDGRADIEGGQRTVEQEQIARLVWQEIINKQKP